MKLIEKNVNDFVEEVASSSPAPGGGSVAALCSALSAALSSMVCNLTLGKERFKDVDEEIKGIKERADSLKEKVLSLVDEDTYAFNLLMEAYKLPKETEEQKTMRNNKIQEETKNAALVPLETAKISLELLELSKIIAKIGNPNAITDAGSAAILGNAAIECALLNVKINLTSIKDTGFVNKTKEEIKKIEQEKEQRLSETLDETNSKIGD